MPDLTILITKYLGDDPQPGVVECQLIDAWGKEWTFVDKVPIFTVLDLGANSPYPQSGALRCRVIRQWQDENGRQLATVNTASPYLVEAATGESHFDVLCEQIIQD